MHPSLSWVRDPTLTPGHGLLPAAATGSCTGHLAKCSLGRTPRCPVLPPPPTPARGARRCLLADAGAPVFTRCLNRTRGEDLALPAPPLLDHSQHPRVSARAHTHMHAHEHTPRLLCKHFHGPEHSTAALAPLGLWASPGGGGRQPLGKPSEVGLGEPPILDTGPPQAALALSAWWPSALTLTLGPGAGITALGLL